MKQVTKLAIILLLIASSQVFANPTHDDKESSSIQGLIIPAVIALIGFLGKSIYEIYNDGRKRRIQNIEEKLKFFYWPILVRLEKDNAIWETILSKKQDQNTVQYKIANSVERNSILKNHQEVLDIIDNYLYLAEPDELFTAEIKKYIKNVTIYKALREAGEETKFPLELGAPWPKQFFQIVKDKTEYFQNKLNKEPF
ncbi:hypothetical protein [Spirosoma panaciterrae]|uniref:hypothetical protein n=1 Tax=Spirosoma panaciterrae TaxID=496058 RepID=UPI00037170E9|nr:hypothetical protein [Spirosoma panaciterrae]